MFAGPIILIGMIYLFINTQHVMLCAGFYTFITFVLGLIFGVPILPLLVTTAIRFVLAYIYFWLLKRFWGSILYWVFLIGGIVIGLV